MSAPVTNLDRFVSDIAAALGADNITTAASLLVEYGRHSLPMPDRIPAAIVYPGSTADVQVVVRTANRYSVPLFPISTGWNLGLGTRSPMADGQVVVDLSRRMNRIVEIDEELGYCVVEPGVTFAAMSEELARRGSELVISPTSGPPQGGLLGNALDKGGGSGPHGSHFENLCGLEVVLGNGEIIRTGEGGLDSEIHPNWHVTKFSFGPALDGLFTQSNYGIVTRAGMWLGRKPGHVESFFFTFPEDDDFRAILELIRPLKASGTIPTLVRVLNDMYLLANRGPSPHYKPGHARRAMNDDERRSMRREFRIGAWTVAGALIGPDRDTVLPALERIKAHFLGSGSARFVSAEEAQGMPIFATILDNNQGRPAGQELRMLDWRGGGASWFTPGLPMRSALGQDCVRESRDLCAREGIDYMVSFVCGNRFARGVHAILFDRADPDEAARADACYRGMSEIFRSRGIFIGRAPTEYQSFHHGHRTAAISDACAALKRALDPNGVIAPGRYGIS